MCPVCGFRGLKEPSYDQQDVPSYEICSCCGFEFGCDEKQDMVRFREAWIGKGAAWFTPDAKPVDWKLQQQLNDLDREATKKRLSP